MKELSPPTLNLRRLQAETSPGEPILIIISPGADPSQELLELVRTTVGLEKYHEVKQQFYFETCNRNIVVCGMCSH